MKKQTPQVKLEATVDAILKLMNDSLELQSRINYALRDQSFGKAARETLLSVKRNAAYVYRTFNKQRKTMNDMIRIYKEEEELQ